jgi:alkanesulfonate monooxygenase SsuD/methylene tetrahydromethanopterin reductase-like flavin-dependent oxidoreductase (luciferase family)
MKKLNANLSEIFDVEPIKEEPKVETLPAVIEYADPVNADAEFARDNIRELVTQGNQAVNELMLIARDGQHPRAFEVLSGLMKNLADMNKDLLEIQKRKKDLAPKAEAQNNLNIDKAVFVGSTAQLVKMLKNQKQET